MQLTLGMDYDPRRVVEPQTETEASGLSAFLVCHTTHTMRATHKVENNFTPFLWFKRKSNIITEFLTLMGSEMVNLANVLELCYPHICYTIHAAGCLNPVSYTHLDVYKRQA